MKNAFLLLVLSSLLWASPPATAAIDNTNSFRDLNTPYRFPEVGSRSEWQNRAREIRYQALVSCGLWPMPLKTPLQPQIFGRVEREGYSVEKVYIQTLPGFYLAGNLYRPLGKGPFPAILNPHGHWQNGRLTDEKDGSIAARCINFAKMGMVAFSYDMVGYNDTFFPEYGTASPEQRYSRHRQFATNEVNLLWSISLMGLQTWNSIRALDFLESLPGVDRKRLACTGESGGGTQTFMLGAVDDRLAAQAPVVMVSHSMQGGCLCENAPGLRVRYSNMEIAASPAPRPQILVAASGDWTKDTMTVEGPAIQHIYDLLNAPDHLRYVRFDFDHNYNQTSREAVYAWFARWLLHRSDAPSLPEQPYKKEPDAELRVFPDGKLPSSARTEEEIIAYLVNRSQGQFQEAVLDAQKRPTNYKKLMEPLWRHSLQLDWPMTAEECSAIPSVSGESEDFTLAASESGAGQVAFTVARSKQAKKQGTVVLANPSDLGLLKDPLTQAGWDVITIQHFAREHFPNQFVNFYCVYNRTKAQERVQDLLHVCGFARHQLKSKKVVLVGSEEAGAWAMLAAPGADAIVADCAQMNTLKDAEWLKPDLFFPSSRKMGGFEGALLLAAPNPALLHNAGVAFSHSNLQQGYTRSAKALRLEAKKIDPAEIARWILAL